jgi:hypothetical protein
VAGKLRYVDADEAYVLAFIGNGGGVEEKSSPSIRACAGKTGPCCIFTTAALGPPNLHKTLGLHG